MIEDTLDTLKHIEALSGYRNALERWASAKALARQGKFLLDENPGVDEIVAETERLKEATEKLEAKCAEYAKVAMMGLFKAVD